MSEVKTIFALYYAIRVPRLKEFSPVITKQRQYCLRFDVPYVICKNVYYNLFITSLKDILKWKNISIKDKFVVLYYLKDGKELS